MYYCISSSTRIPGYIAVVHELSVQQPQSLSIVAAKLSHVYLFIESQSGLGSM